MEFEPARSDSSSFFPTSGSSHGHFFGLVNPSEEREGQSAARPRIDCPRDLSGQPAKIRLATRKVGSFEKKCKQRCEPIQKLF